MCDRNPQSRRSFLKLSTIALGVTTTSAGCISDRQLDDLVTPTPTETDRLTAVPVEEQTPSLPNTPTPDLVREKMTPFEASENSRFDDVEPFEKAIHDDINEMRTERDLSRLIWRVDLAYVARVHSRDMAQRDYFAHENPEGEYAWDRLDRYNVDSFVDIAENIYRTGGADTLTEDDLMERPLEAWMESRPHRESLIDDSWTHEGVGVYLKEAEMFVTQIMGVGKATWWDD